MDGAVGLFVGQMLQGQSANSLPIRLKDICSQSRTNISHRSSITPSINVSSGNVGTLSLNITQSN